MSLYHATCILIKGKGVLLEGPSGAGKSDLALRLMSLGAQLVSDDYITLAKKAGALVATAPEKIAGKMEVRGLGLIDIDHAREAAIDLVIDLKPREHVPRLPKGNTKTLEGVSIPTLTLHAFDASTPDKILLALKLF
ncbi:MAG: hypothetical protein E2O91_04695 [Alphaproteobacteria bacterium]|nr:MAG: hypothetical protein E2O91_04695 [Alphaproteobacteria bacterium]